MGMVRRVLRSVKAVSKYGLWAGGLYTFFGYFYAQEIKHRLGDEEHCQKAEAEGLLRALRLEEAELEYPVKLAMAIMDVYTFYLRTWLYRQFEQDCRDFHKHVIASILRNYHEYGVFAHRAQMQAQVARGEVDPGLLARVLQVRELNLQLLSLYGEKYFAIVRNQVHLRTGAIVGLTAEERAEIELVSAFIEKGERIIFKNEDKYWEYKLMQSEARKHNYGDTIFKIIFI